MEITFYVSAIIAVFATLRVVTCTRAIHALLYMVTSLLATAVVFFILGAPFAAAVLVIVNAGAIMVLFVFVIMMLNLGPEAARQERQWLPRSIWFGPSILTAILIVELVWALVSETQSLQSSTIEAREVGKALFGQYIPGTELAAILLFAGLLGAYHLGRKMPEREDGKL